MEDAEIVKLIVLGESSVGKSSMIVRYAKGMWDSGIGSTIGIELFTTQATVDN